LDDGHHDSSIIINICLFYLDDGVRYIGDIVIYTRICCFISSEDHWQVKFVN